MASTPYPNNLAGNGDHGGYFPFQLFAGEKEIVTSQAICAPLQGAFAQFEVFALDGNGMIAKYNPAGVSPLNRAVGVTAQPIDANQSGTAMYPYYRSAYFNHEALTWPAGMGTLEARKAALIGSEIEVGALLGSDVY